MVGVLLFSASEEAFYLILILIESVYAFVVVLHQYVFSSVLWLDYFKF
jgi:hypothetical protein